MAVDHFRSRGVKQHVIFLDKDGTLIKDRAYNVDPDKITLERGAARGLQRLGEAGYRFVVVSNQSGVARGYFAESALEGVRERLEVLLKQKAGVTLAGFFYCPHHPDGTVPGYAIDCECRKPRPGMLFQAAEKLGIHLTEAWMVGDILNDVEAGKRAGCRTILIDNGHETEWIGGPYRTPDYTAVDLDRAANIILEQDHTGPVTKRQSLTSLLKE